MSMKVSGIYSAYEVYKTGKASSAGRMSRAEEKKDMVALSGHAKDFQAALKAVRSEPDVRNEKVSDIRSRIESGNYHVSSKDVADRILNSI